MYTVGGGGGEEDQSQPGGRAYLFWDFSNVLSALWEGGDREAASAIQSLQQVQFVAADAVTLTVRSD